MAENDPLISVIVPIYKVESYLRKCIDSILCQTYRNLEIILVDDGSPDACPQICDEYAAKDSRVEVIHKSNGGLSSARNAGLAAASGTYIGWVDSDDWTEPDMFGFLLEGMLREKADIGICAVREVDENGGIQKVNQGERAEVFSKTEALKTLLKDKEIQNHMWNKLWRKELFTGVTFPEGRNFEDVAVTYRLFEKAERVCYLPELKYNYRLRSDSIIGDSSLKNRLNFYTAAESRCRDLVSRYPEIESLAKSSCVKAAIGIWCGYYDDGKEEREESLPQLKEISAFCGDYEKNDGENMGLGLAGKIVRRLICYPKPWSFRVSHIISRLYKLKHGKPL